MSQAKTDVRIDHDKGSEGTVQVKHSMDVTSTLEAAKRSREMNSGKPMGDLVRLVSFPVTVLIEIHKKYRLGKMVHGSIKFDADERKKLVKIVQQDYPYLMMIDGKFA